VRCMTWRAISARLYAVEHEQLASHVAAAEEERHAIASVGPVR
jgi:hypothetical protein